MATFFEMPQASPTMTSGVLLSWKKKEGDKLVPQDKLAEVETDKAAMDVEVFDNGYLLKILAAEGEEVICGTPIAILGTRADEDISALMAEFTAKKGAPIQVAPVAQVAGPPPSAPSGGTSPRSAGGGDPIPTTSSPPTGGRSPEGGEGGHAPPPAPTRPGYVAPTWMGRALDPGIQEPDVVWNPPEARVRASPSARRAAREHNLDLGDVAGTGPRGRVTRADVERASQPAVVAAPTPGRPDETVRNSQMRKTIARRLTEVWTSAPSFYLTATLSCDQLVTFREQLKAAGVGTTYNVLLIAACARALRDVPEVNASWGADAITRHGRVHIGVAVALPDGLITPVLKDADTKGLVALTTEIKELADRAKALKLKPEEYQGSTFTISNLGMMDIEHFTAILNPPEACILAVGAMNQEPVVEAGQIVVRWRMRVTLTCDHRVVDGALGARFLQALRRYVEHPALLAS